MKLFLQILFLLLASDAVAASFEVSPREVSAGGVVLVRMEMSRPAFAVTRWNERPVYFDMMPDGARVLLEVPLDMPPGRYPVSVAVVDHSGRTSRYFAEVAVSSSSRPVERLTLPPAMVSPKKKVVLKQIERDHKRLSEIYQRETPSLFWSGARRPVADQVGSLFGLQRILNGKPRSPHSGVDFRSPRGTPVHSPAAGRVALVDDLYYTGKTVVVDHGGGLISVFAHLEKADVIVGSHVPEGALLGQVGSTGRSTGPHLHWTVRLRGEKIDPLALLSLLQRESP